MFSLLPRTSAIGIQPDSVNAYQIEEKFFTLSPNTYDIGAYLKLLYIKPHQIININLKEGNYTWNENYVTPEFTTIKMTGEKCKIGGKDNVVTILINQKNSIFYEGRQCAVNSRLQISSKSYFYMCGIDIIEKINDEREKYPSSQRIGVFNLCGTFSESTFCLICGQFEISSSPFINVRGNNVRGKINLNCSHFSRSTLAKESEISIIDTNNGWSYRGSYADVCKTCISLNPGCKLLTKDSIIYHD